MNQLPKKANPHDATLLIHASAKQPQSPLLDLTQRVTETRCLITDAHVHCVGDEVFVMLLISGSWDAVAKLENQLSRINHSQWHDLSWRRSSTNSLHPTHMPYMVEVTCVDKPGVVFELAAFFARQQISVQSLTSSKYQALHSGVPMFGAQLMVCVPSDAHIATLRDEFLEFCDHMNLDAAMDPLKY